MLPNKKDNTKVSLRSIADKNDFLAPKARIMPNSSERSKVVMARVFMMMTIATVNIMNRKIYKTKLKIPKKMTVAPPAVFHETAFAEMFWDVKVWLSR